jgi:hypothetical protein
MTRRRESDRLREARDVLDRVRSGRAPSLFDETDEAIESVADHAGPVWFAQALDSVRRAAIANPTLTALDARMRCTDCDAYDNRAWGQVMRAAAAKGWIRQSGEYRRGPAETHGRPLTVWRSNIFEFADDEWHDGAPKRVRR